MFERAQSRFDFTLTQDFLRPPDYKAREVRLSSALRRPGRT